MLLAMCCCHPVAMCYENQFVAITFHSISHPLCSILAYVREICAVVLKAEAVYLQSSDFHQDCIPAQKCRTIR